MKQGTLRTNRVCVFCGKMIKRGQKAYLLNNKLYEHIEHNVRKPYESTRNQYPHI